MKKRFFYTSLFIWVWMPLVSQHMPQHSQYFLNNYLLNPAITGIENYADVKLSGRSQWTGIEGAPQTAYASVHAPIYFKPRKHASANPVKPGDFRSGSQERMEGNQTGYLPTAHHGLGGMLLSDGTGNYSRYQAMISYAYHLPLNPSLYWSVGAAGGAAYTRLDLSNVVLANQNDPLLQGQNDQQWRGIMQLGTWIYHQNFYLGASYFQFFSDDPFLNTPSTSAYQSLLDQQLFLTGGYRIRFSSAFTLAPSILAKYATTGNTWSVDATAKATFYDRFWAGVSLRELQSLNVFVGMAVTPFFEFSYAYDAGVGQFDQYSTGSHEVLLGFRIGNTQKIYCPDNFW